MQVAELDAEPATKLLKGPERKGEQQWAEHGQHHETPAVPASAEAVAAHQCSAHREYRAPPRAPTPRPPNVHRPLSGPRSYGEQPISLPSTYYRSVGAPFFSKGKNFLGSL